MQYLITFLEGFISFLSPCMLPMLPVYLSYFAGNADKKHRILLRAGCFVLGFTLVFSLMGLFAGTLSTLLMRHQTVVNIVTGAIVIVFGLSYLELIPLPFLRGMQTRREVAGAFSAFVFGMMCVESGLSPLMAALISMTNLTSAGQFAGLTIIAASGSLIEMALSQFVINLRYFLMSLSLTQKVDPQMPRPQRAIISFGVTDEIFALSSSRYNGVGFRYMVGLMTLPIAAWTLGTLCGGVASGLLPQAVRDALGIMIYGMFLAIILPPCRKSKQITAVVACASLLSCLSALLQAYVPISSGFVIIICTVAAASLGAWLFPVQEENT